MMISFTLFELLKFPLEGYLCVLDTGADLPERNTPYMHLFPLETLWHYGIDKITLLGL